MSSCINASVKVIEVLISPLIRRIQNDTSGGKEAWNPNAAAMTAKVMNWLRSWHVTCLWYRQKQSPAMHHNLWALMLGASCSLELSEILLPKHKNPRHWRRHCISLTKGCTQLRCVNSICKERMKMMPQVFKYPVQKGVILTVWFKWEVG